MNNITFFEQVYEVVKQIPEGKVSTYGIIADLIGHAQAARMVGYAMNASHQMPDVPAHRVVNRNGLLTGRHHFNPPEKMQKLLEKEGIKVEDHKIVDFENHLWNPKMLY